MEIRENLSKDLKRKPYDMPKVILRQPLEALAGFCDENFADGKAGIPGCVTINS